MIHVTKKSDLRILRIYWSTNIKCQKFRVLYIMAESQDLIIKIELLIWFYSWGGWLQSLFIYWIICWSNKMVALLLCYHFTALCTFKVLLLFVIFGGSCLIIIMSVGLYRLLLQLRWPFLEPSFFSAHFAATSFQPTTRR